MKTESSERYLQIDLELIVIYKMSWVNESMFQTFKVDFKLIYHEYNNILKISSKTNICFLSFFNIQGFYCEFNVSRKYRKPN